MNTTAIVPPASASPVDPEAHTRFQHTVNGILALSERKGCPDAEVLAPAAA